MIQVGGGVSVPHRSWDWARNADVNVVDGLVPPIFDELKNRIFIAHGSPRHCFRQQLLGFDPALEVSINMVRDCELVVTWNKEYVRYWSAFTEPGKVRWVPGGIDLSRWSRLGERFTFDSHPQVGFMEMPRLGKMPFTFLFAVKKAHKSIPSLRVQLLNIDVDDRVKLLWMMLVTRLDLNRIVGTFGVGPHPDPGKVYRSLDILVSPVEGGVLSTVGGECLASGTPVIILEGDPEFQASEKCRDDPASMGEAIIRLWRRMVNDEEGVRAEAQRLAKKHDIAQTTEQLLRLYSEYFDLPLPKRVEKRRIMDRYWSGTPASFGYEEDRGRVMAALCEGLTLDLGSGKGCYTKLLPAPVALDLSRVALEEIRGSRVLGDAARLPFRYEAFNSVLASELLEHVDDDVKTVEEVFRVLRPNGTFVFSVPNGLREEWYGSDWQSSTHKRLYTPEILRRLLKDVKFHPYRSGDPLRELRLVGSKKKGGQGTDLLRPG